MKLLSVIIIVFFTSYVAGIDEIYEDITDTLNLDPVCLEGMNVCKDFLTNSNCNNKSFWKRLTRGGDELGPFWANRGKKAALDTNRNEGEPFWAMRGKKDPFWATRGKKEPFWANRGKKVQEDAFWANRGKKTPTFSISRLFAEEPHWKLMRRDDESRYDPYFTTRGKKLLIDEESTLDRQTRDNLDAAATSPFLAARGKKDTLDR